MPKDAAKANCNIRRVVDGRQGSALGTQTLDSVSKKAIKGRAGSSLDTPEVISLACLGRGGEEVVKRTGTLVSGEV